MILSRVTIPIQAPCNDPPFIPIKHAQGQTTVPLTTSSDISFTHHNPMSLRLPSAPTTLPYPGRTMLLSSDNLNPATMTHHLLLPHGLHLPTQQLPQLRTNHLLLRLRLRLRLCLLIFPNSTSLSSAILPRIATRRRRSRTRSVGSGRRRFLQRFPLADVGSGEVMFLVDGLDGALEAAEEGLGCAERALEVD